VGKRYDLEKGDVFNSLTVVSKAEKTSGQLRWLCICICGNYTEVDSFDLRNGKTKSCGCQQYLGTHGKTGTRIYRIWAGMLSRCSNPTQTAYRYYGGRGISVCDRWKKFENFYEDMGEAPGPEYSIDRIDSDGDYCPENVKWATPLEQWENRKIQSTSFSFYQGETRKTAIYPSETQLDALIYCALGLGSEASEVCGKVKKLIRDNGYELSADVKSSIMDEMGDTLWYISELANSLDVSLETIALRNLRKLNDRKQRGVLQGSGDER
jgi:NTP pyrophosphatase (non-canonical NTP hydrolase)